MTGRRRSARVIVLAVVIGILTIGAAGWWIWQSADRAPTAEQTVSDYLRALESGDGDAVAAVVPDLSPAAVRAFDGATDLITDARVTGIEMEGDDAAVAEVSFRLAGEDHAARLTVLHRGGRWSVPDTGLGRLTATSSLGSFVAVGEQALATEEPVLLPPAGYRVAAAPTSMLEGAVAVTVLPGGDEAAAVSATRRPEAEDAAVEWLEAHLETCTEPAAEPPAGCGIRIPWGTEFRAVDEIRFRVEQAPTLSLSDDAFRATDGVLVATVHGTGQDGGERTVTYRTESWSLRGDVSYTADDLVLTPW